MILMIPLSVCLSDKKEVTKKKKKKGKSDMSYP